MMRAAELAQTWRDGALVIIGDMIRPAAFVFVDDAGLSWVEPSYTDPEGAASPALHRRDGVVEVVADWLEVRSGDQLVTVQAFVPDIHAGDDGGALAWFAEHLASTGQAWESERDKVRGLISL